MYAWHGMPYALRRARHVVRRYTVQLRRVPFNQDGPLKGAFAPCRWRPFRSPPRAVCACVLPQAYFWGDFYIIPNPASGTVVLGGTGQVGRADRTTRVCPCGLCVAPGRWAAPCNV